KKSTRELGLSVLICIDNWSTSICSAIIFPSSYVSTSVPSDTSSLASSSTASCSSLPSSSTSFLRSSISFSNASTSSSSASDSPAISSFASSTLSAQSTKNAATKPTNNNVTNIIKNISLIANHFNKNLVLLYPSFAFVTSSTAGNISFNSFTCDITPIVRPNFCKSINVSIALCNDSSSSDPKPSSINIVSIVIFP